MGQQKSKSQQKRGTPSDKDVSKDSSTLNDTTCGAVNDQNPSKLNHPSKKAELFNPLNTQVPSKEVGKVEVFKQPNCKEQTIDGFLSQDHSDSDDVATQVSTIKIEPEKLDSFTLGDSPSRSHFSSVSCPSDSLLANTDKLAEPHDCGEDKGLIYKNPASEGNSTSTVPHSNGRIPHPNGESRDTYSPSVAVVTEESIQIELSDSEKDQCPKTDSEIMITTAARNIVEDAIQKAVASEVVSFVICRTLGFLLVERATTNAQRLLNPESV